MMKAGSSALLPALLPVSHATCPSAADASSNDCSTTRSGRWPGIFNVFTASAKKEQYQTEGQRLFQASLDLRSETAQENQLYRPATPFANIILAVSSLIANAAPGRVTGVCGTTTDLVKPSDTSVANAPSWVSGFGQRVQTWGKWLPTLNFLPFPGAYAASDDASANTNRVDDQAQLVFDHDSFAPLSKQSCLQKPAPIPSLPCECDADLGPFTILNELNPALSQELTNPCTLRHTLEPLLFTNDELLSRQPELVSCFVGKYGLPAKATIPPASVSPISGKTLAGWNEIGGYRSELFEIVGFAHEQKYDPASWIQLCDIVEAWDDVPLSERKDSTLESFSRTRGFDPQRYTEMLQSLEHWKNMKRPEKNRLATIGFAQIYAVNPDTWRVVVNNKGLSAFKQTPVSAVTEPDGHEKIKIKDLYDWHDMQQHGRRRGIEPFSNARRISTREFKKMANFDGSFTPYGAQLLQELRKTPAGLRYIRPNLELGGKITEAHLTEWYQGFEPRILHFRHFLEGEGLSKETAQTFNAWKKLSDQDRTKMTFGQYAQIHGVSPEQVAVGLRKFNEFNTMTNEERYTYVAQKFALENHINAAEWLILVKSNINANRAWHRSNEPRKIPFTTFVWEDNLDPSQSLTVRSD